MCDKLNKIWILTLFPENLRETLSMGVAGQALSGKRSDRFELNIIQIRDFSSKDYKGVDDAPFGGGVGMVMRADILKNALFEGVIGPGNYGENFKEKLHVISTGPRGLTWNNVQAQKLSKRFWSNTTSSKDLVFICGRYEGIDERFIETFVDEEVCIGDYVLTGGELAVSVIIDSSLRFSEGVLGNGESSEFDSFQDGLLEHPQYTRPRVFEGISIPEVLLSGHHNNIKQFRISERERITASRRSDLYDKYLESRK